MKAFVTFASVVLFLVAGVRGDAVACWEKKCRECPTSSQQIAGTEFKCEPRGLVTVAWLDQVDQMQPYNPAADNVNNNSNNGTVGIVPVGGDSGFKYSCIKMLASDPKISGDSTDLISGCARKDDAENLCKTLKDVQAKRGKTDYKCLVCHNDLCNGASSLAKGTTLLSVMASAMFMIKNAMA